MQTLTELVTKYSAKAAGVYREIIDGTADTTPAASERNVVVVGQFKKGPVMRPVYCANPTIAHNIFGPRDITLEAKGCYGMLIAEHALEAGPVWILNVKNIDQYHTILQSMVVRVSSKDAATAEVKQVPMVDVYDTTKFWNIDQAYGKYGADSETNPTMLLTAVSNNNLTVIIQKYASENYRYTIGETKQYNPTFDNPTLPDNAYVEDYLVRATVFKKSLSASQTTNLTIEKLEALKADAENMFFAEYTGTIGDVIDINGNNLNIQTAINNDMQASGLYMSLNVDMIAAYGIDPLGLADRVAANPGALPFGLTSALENLAEYTVSSDGKMLFAYTEGMDMSAYQQANVYTGSNSIARVKSVQLVDVTESDTTVKKVEVELDKPAEASMKWCKYTAGFLVNAIAGYTELDTFYVNGTAARQKLVLDKLNEAGIMNSFADPTIFTCRYMLDSFKTYIEPNAKYQYAKLAAYAQRFPVITAAPFYHELRTCKNPDFRDALGQFSMALVAKGFNPDRPSTNSRSYAQGEQAAYLWPFMNVQYSDGFTSKVIPSVGAIGKLKMLQMQGTQKCYNMLAGPAYPVSAAGITGQEFTTSEPDRAAYEKMGINTIVVVNDILQIRSNKTAYQTVKSAMNHPESLEKCLYVSDMVEPVMNGRLFKFNNADARTEVKLYADDVCQAMLADGAIVDYENVCDLSNNTAEVRKAGIIVLDTTLYNEYGIVIGVHRTTIKNPQE